MAIIAAAKVWIRASSSETMHSPSHPFRRKPILPYQVIAIK
ncbi:MAG: hypothetical protein A4E51_00590 [Methanosaeta sp. PtaU1.Bin055]|nr:MAG: hypothetical protein A4E51_00590 [Methanosaeta sp. PtaU1.Bin055]